MDRCESCFREFEGAVCPHCGYPEKINNASHQLPVGTMIRERYRIGKVLGQGGFGITYLAWDMMTHQTVAAKEFYPAGAVFRKSAVSLVVECITEEMVPHYEQTKERFLREANTLVKFRDIPEVVDILDHFRENNTAYIIMEYVKGADLERYIEMRGGRLSVEETFRILKPVMEALAKVHKGGIVHRDISPDNIILDPMGGAKLLDFGAVRTVEAPAVGKPLTKSTEAIIKRGFAPIEQHNSRGGLGPWTDEYAMCATVWTCLTGSVPEEASVRITEGIDPDWSTIPGLPEHQQKALAKGFSRLAKDRYPGMDALLRDLFPEVEKEETISIRKKSKDATVTEKIPKKRRKRGWLWAIPAVLAVLLAVAVLFLNADRPDPLPGPLPVHTPTEETAPKDTIPSALETRPTETEETEPPTTEPVNPEEEAYLHAEALLAEGKLGEAAIAFGKLSGFSDARERSFAIWDKIAVRDTLFAREYHTIGLRADGTVVAVGYNYNGQCNVSVWTDVVAIATGDLHTVALRADGTVVAMGDNGDGQCDVSGWTDVVAISADHAQTVGLRADGTVVAVGNNDYGQCDVSDWTDVVAIVAGGSWTVGLRADSTVLAVGNNDYGQCDVSDWTDVVAIVAGDLHTVGLRADGTVVAVGGNYQGQCNVSGWTDVVAISAGIFHTVGLRADGTVVAVGNDNDGQLSVSDWTDVVAIATAGGHTVGLRADGTAVAVGYDDDGQCGVSGWTGVVTISAGNYHTVGLRADGTVVAVGDNEVGQCDVASWTDIRLPQKRVPFR